MTFGHGSSSRLLLNDVNPSGQIQSWTCEAGREFADVTTILDGGYRWLPGQVGGKVTVQGLFDSAAGTLHQEIVPALGTDDGLLWTLFPSGYATIGLPALISVCDIESYALTSGVSDAVKVEVDTTPDAGPDWGVLLHALGAETADVNSVSVDNAAASTNGAAASLHVTAYTGLTSAVVKVQHSTNNSTWADLITFTTVIAATAQRSTVTGTVNRYVRAVVDVTGTGSITYAVAFARR